MISIAPVDAQTSEDAIRRAISEGEKVRISAEGGHDYRGRIVALGTTSLTLADGREQTDVPYAQITRIDRQGDSLWNGTLFGLAAGMGVGVIAASKKSRDSDSPFCGMGVLDDCSDDSTAGVLVSTGLGGLMGAFVDGLINRKRTVYRRGAGTEVVFAPMIAPSHHGARLSIAW